MNQKTFLGTVLCLTLLPLFAGGAMAQQELFVLGRFNKIWRIDNHDTATPTLTEVVTWGMSSANLSPVGLEVDPSTGDFWVLTSTWNGAGTNSELLRVDATTGSSQVIMNLPAGSMRGLDRRWDGKMYSIDSQQDLWLIDPSTGTWTVERLSTDVGSFWSPLAIDSRGEVLSENGNLVSIDPISGAVTPLAATMPNTSQLGIEVDVGGVLYSTGIIGDLHRYDPAVGSWVQLIPMPDAINNGYDLAFRESVDGAGFAEVCGGQPNSTGLASTLELIGSNVAAAGDLELAARQLPPNRFGFYVMSASAGSFPVGQGVLCLGFPVYRYSSNVLNSGAAGEVRFPLNLNQLANGLAAMPGDTYFFQFWHRDSVQGVGTSNLSDAASVTFQ